MLMHQAPSHRRQPLLKKGHSSTASAGSRLGEVVGGTAAECAAVCCCCPCGLMHLLVLAFYKVPAALCRRAIRNKRRAQLMKKGLLPQRLRRRCSCGCDDSEIPIHSMCVDHFSEMKSQNSEEVEKEAVELEKEMWDMFYGTGFWRSPSTREASPNLTYNPAKSNFQIISQ